TLPLLAACYVSAQTTAPDVAPEFVVKASADWVKYPYTLDIIDGSIFDFSSLNHVPAGRYGRVISTPAGHFAFTDRPDVPVRFWGVNLCFSANFLKPEVADQLALTLRRAGYNTVRLHHFDRDLVVPGGLSHKLDPVKLDRINYLFARLKAAGLYISTDLYHSRRFSEAELPELGREFGPEFKRLLPLSDKAFESWKLFARKLLTQVNPYTGLTWGEDPALIGICPVNEDSTVGLPKDPALLALYEKAGDAWIAENPALCGPDRTVNMMRFIADAFARNDARMAAFLRDELKVTVPLTGSNYRTAQMLAALRAGYDYVDNHQYWDHPEFAGADWGMPYKFIQQSATKRSARAPGAMMPTRIFGRPFTVTEYNFSWPNQYRAEGGLIMPAYASLQDWDAIYNFDYAPIDSKVIDVGRSTTFGISSDPIGLLADRFAAVAFLRRDIKPAVHAIGFVVRDESVYAPGQSKERSYPESFTLAGLVSRIGTYTGQPGLEAPAFLVTDAPRDGDAATPAIPIIPVENLTAELAARAIVAEPTPGGTSYLSDTGEIDLRPDVGSLKVIAPRLEGFVLPAGHSASGKVASVVNGAAFGSVYLLSADGADLTASKRILLLHLTDALNTAARFTDASRRTLNDYGSVPQLVRKGDARLTLTLDRSGPGVWRLWKVAANGARQTALPLIPAEDGAVHALLETVTADGTCLAYELVNE
ncbi:MAG: hypothetical protein H7Y06_03460, partial [Opitutaceae bacterium]|nr:hypothetical protein [Opitutaceae bacterium]